MEFPVECAVFKLSLIQQIPSEHVRKAGVAYFMDANEKN